MPDLHELSREMSDGGEMPNKPENKLQLSAEREKLFELLLLNKGINLPARHSITRSRDPVGLSIRQQWIWQSEQLDPGRPFNNVVAVIGLRGELNKHAVGEALNETLRRHEILRTSYPAVDGRPSPILHAHATTKLWIIDLTGLPAVERPAAMGDIVDQQGLEPFDLSEPPIRMLLLAVDQSTHFLVLALHQLTSDGLSVAILLREFKDLYTAFTSGRPSSLDELQIQYSDYAAWQRQRTGGHVLQREVHYWRENLQSVVNHLVSPRLNRRRAGPSRISTVALEVPADLLSGIREVMRIETLTLFMVLLAGFTLLLSLQGEQDILAGSPIDLRLGSRSEDLIGLFVNVVALRIDLSGLNTIKQLLKKVREVALGAYDHQEIPFEMLLKELDPARSSDAPFFPAMLVMRNAIEYQLAAGDLMLSVEALDESAAGFDLMLVMEERTDGLKGVLKYNADLYQPDRINRMTGQFKSILRTIIDDREASLARFQLMSEWA